MQCFGQSSELMISCTRKKPRLIRTGKVAASYIRQVTCLPETPLANQGQQGLHMGFKFVHGEVEVAAPAWRCTLIPFGAALPMVSTAKHIHLINPFIDPYGGSEQRTLALFDLLSSQTTVTLWCEGTPHDAFSQFPIRLIKPFAKQYPVQGTIVLVGAYFRAGSWIAHANARRVIQIYNTYAHEQLYTALRYYRDLGIELVELVFASRALKDACCLEGIVQTSPIDLGHFAPSQAITTSRTPRPFTVGRLSRDIGSKHHPSDPGIYRELVQAGCNVRIMGGTCLRGALGDHPRIELLPAGAEQPEVFLRSLDCFLYRTSDDWHESFGRVVMEAMACRLPVVVHRAGDYSEYVEHGKTGFLFQSDQDAVGTVLLLKNNHGLRATIGDAAVASAKTMMEGVANAIHSYYLA